MTAELPNSDTNTLDLSVEQNPEIVAILEEYLVDLEQGRCPSHEELLARYPEFAEQLGPYLEKLEELHHAAVGLRPAPHTGETAAKSDQQEIGTLGDFRILHEIGRGGMGVVYEAEQISLGRRVALKVLPFAAVLDQRQLQRFKNEAQAAAVLKHPHIVGVHCVGCERGVHFYAMELVEGHSVAEVIEQLRRGASQDAGATAGLSQCCPGNFLKTRLAPSA